MNDLKRTEKIEVLRNRLQKTEARLGQIAEELADLLYPMESRLASDGPKIGELGRDYERAHAEGLRIQRTIEDLVE